MALTKGNILEKEIEAVLGVLDELVLEFKEYSIFEDVKKSAEKIIIQHNVEIKKVMAKNNISPRRTAYSWINNVSGDMLESGKYHIYRGVLNELTGGDDLLKIFDISTDKLVEVGDMDKDKAEQHKKNIRDCIRSLG